MSILFMDGAERNSASQFTEFTGAIAAVGTSGMTGAYYLMFSNENRYWKKTLSTSYAELYLTFKRIVGYYGGYRQDIIQFRDSAGTFTLSVIVNLTSHNIEIRSGDYNGTLLATGSAVLDVGAVSCIEIYYSPLNSAGECTVKVNGVIDVTYTGDTTAGLENVQTISALGISGGYDDIVVSDSGWLGNQYIQLIVPTGAGDSTQWDPSTGANYACVDEVTASDTDYVSTNVADEVDLYALGNLAGSINSVTAINVCARMAYEGTPTPTKQKIAIKSTGEYYGSDVSPALTFADNFKLFELDPNGDIAWTESTVNALQAGVKAVA